MRYKIWVIGNDCNDQENIIKEALEADREDTTYELFGKKDIKRLLVNRVNAPLIIVITDYPQTEVETIRKCSYLGGVIVYSDNVKTEKDCIERGADDFCDSLDETKKRVSRWLDTHYRVKDVETGLYTRYGITEIYKKEKKKEDHSLILAQFDTFGLTKEEFVKIRKKIVSNYFNKHFFKSGAYIAQFSEDTFLILSPRIKDDKGNAADEKNAEMKVREIIKGITESIAPLAEITINIKAGVVLEMKQTTSFQTHCNWALTALEHADGSRGVGFYQENSVELLRSIKKAVDADEIKVYYQPKHLPNGKLVGAEALVRWIKGDGSRVYPNQFIPLAERSGDISKIDHYVLERVVANQKKWLESGIDIVPVSVNVSKKDIRKRDFEKWVKAAVDVCGADHLHLEITESAYDQNASVLFDKVARIRSELGVKVEMDDFGTGVSSLAALTEVPFDVLKIDQSFIKTEKDEVHNKQKKLIFKNVVQLAKDIDKTVVVEGLEKEEQRSLMEDCMYDDMMIQGYCFHAPMPEDEFEEYLQKGTWKPVFI